MAFHDNLVSMLEKYKEFEKKLELGANNLGAEFANLSKFAKELDKIKAGGVALEARDLNIWGLVSSKTHLN